MSGWQPIETAPCDDRMAWVRFQNGGVNIMDLDHDSDPEWWAERGATHWKDPTEADLDAYEKWMEANFCAVMSFDEGIPPPEAP